MSLPHDEAGLRELEQKCESREAAASKRTVTRLQAKPPGYREGFIINCCIYGLANLVRCAIEASVSPNTRAAASKPAKNMPVLGLAAGEGHAHVVKLLLDNGADLLLYDDHDMLLHATQNGHEACVSLLIGGGADAMRADVVGNTPLMTAVIGKYPVCSVTASRLGPGLLLAATGRYSLPRQRNDCQQRVLRAAAASGGRRRSNCGGRES
jgi:hypothetical protein